MSNYSLCKNVTFAYNGGQKIAFEGDGDSMRFALWHPSFDPTDPGVPFPPPSWANAQMLKTHWAIAPWREATMSLFPACAKVRPPAISASGQFPPDCQCAKESSAPPHNYTDLCYRGELQPWCSPSLGSFFFFPWLLPAVRFFNRSEIPCLHHLWTHGILLSLFNCFLP